MAPLWTHRHHLCPAFPFLAAAALLLAGCGSPSAPSTPDAGRALPVQASTAHYVFHSAAGDTLQSEAQERYHEWMTAQLGVVPDRPIMYYKYRDRSHMQQITGKLANAWADPPMYAVHSIWPWDNHEVVHVMTAMIGRPTDFFNEGMAVAMQMDPMHDGWEPMWNSRHIHAWASEYHMHQQLPSLAEMCETDAFRRMDDTRSYPMAGSFMRFMLDEYGMSRMKDFFRSGSRDARRAEIEGQFSAAFGITLTEAESRWHQFLRGRR